MNSPERPLGTGLVLALWVVASLSPWLAAPEARAQAQTGEQANTPARAEQDPDWSQWSGRLPIEVRRERPELAGRLPIEVTFALRVDSMADATHPRREIRLVYAADGDMKIVPFQLSRLSVRHEDTGEASVPTLTGRVTFFEVTPYDPDGRYLLLYGNDESSVPHFETDLEVRGNAPGWTIENSVMVARLHGSTQKGSERSQMDGASGQLASVTLKSHPNRPFTNRHGMLHWNPGISIPQRGWIHAYEWNPPAQVEIERGPIFVEVRRSGPFPQIPEARLEITYRFYKGRPFVWSGTHVEITEDVGVMALRNDELVFDPELFTHLAWSADGELHRKRFDDYKPVNEHGDILRLAADVPMVTFYNPETRLGAATVRLAAMNIGPMASSPPLFDQATYITDDEKLTYWFRSQVYLHSGWPRQRLITVPAGSRFSERNLYCFYDMDRWGAVRRVRQLSAAARHEPDVRIGAYRMPPSQ